MTIADKRKEYRLINILFKRFTRRNQLNGGETTFETNKFFIR